MPYHVLDVKSDTVTAVMVAETIASAVIQDVQVQVNISPAADARAILPVIITSVKPIAGVRT